MKKLLKSIYKNNKPIFYLTFFVAIVSALAEISSWVVQKNILDNLVVLDKTSKILFLLVLLFITYAVNQIFWALTYFYSNKFWESVFKDYRKKALDKFNRIKFSIILDKKEWEINSIISEWTKSIWEVVDKFFGHILQNSLMIIFWLTVLFFLDVYIFLFFLFIFIPFFVFYSVKEIKKIVPRSKKINDKQNKVSWEVVEYLSNIRDIKIFWVESNFINSFFNEFLKIFKLEMNVEKSHHFMNFYQFIILFWSMCIVLAYTWYNITQGILTIGSFILVYHIFWTIRYALWDMVYLYRNFEENFIKINKLLDFFDIEEQNQNIHKIEWKFDNLEIKNLSFSYDNKIEILKNINFSIKSSEKIAIIWKSWEWKTTLISLILWLFDWYKWDIFFNNKKVNWKITNMFSYVPQNTSMFNDSIRFNLTLWEKFDDKILISILKKVWLDYLKSRVDSGKSILDIQVGSDWLKLSGWEKQRLWIARAMIREKDIYIFDEITSNLDEETEKSIIDLIFEIAKNKTFIVITHRKEILKKVDSIYEMKKWELKIIT